MATQRVVETFIEYNIPYLTLYAFSTENWNRPEDDVNGLFKLLEERLDEGIKFAQENEIKVRHLGKPDDLPPRLRARVKRTLELTQNNSQMTLSLAFNYGGRHEIVEAIRHLILDGVPAQEIDETLVADISILPIFLTLT